ncbi:MAG: glycine zipper domain-containing protein [Patescibacteria group bacterium]
MKKTIILMAVLILLSGCANHAQYRATEGALIGAVAGKAWGGSDNDALIGGLIGTGIGYILGNEEDKYYGDRYHRSRRYSREYRPSYEPDYYEYHGNAGVREAYHKGRARYYRDRQREAERRARDLGRAGW